MIAIPPFNDPDVFAHCVGFIAIRDPKNSQKLLGFNVTAGGGMGTWCSFQSFLFFHVYVYVPQITRISLVLLTHVVQENRKSTLECALGL